VSETSWELMLKSKFKIVGLETSLESVFGLDRS